MAWLTALLANGLAKMVLAIVGCIFSIYIGVFILRFAMSLLRTILERTSDIGSIFTDWIGENIEKGKDKLSERRRERKVREEQRKRIMNEYEEAVKGDKSMEAFAWFLEKKRKEFEKKAEEKKEE